MTEWRAAKRALARQAQDLIKDMDVITDHSAVSKHTWAKNIHPSAGDRSPCHDNRWVDGLQGHKAVVALS